MAAQPLIANDVIFDFRDCSVTLDTAPASTILHEVSGRVVSGHLFAIMGPSGAGKTTLLNLLAGMPGSSHERRFGTITLNGNTFTGTTFKDYCAVVTQHDRNWTFLTCREHVELAHAFFQASMTSVEREAANEGLLERTGLLSCADLKCGTDIPEEMGPVGLSGGQRRRLSLAVALAKKPSLLIADEPTSGLDAAAAAEVMRVVKELGTSDHMAVLCTIHQPSARVFECIDQLLVLSKGRTVYLGPGAELALHTALLGSPVPPGVSIAEHMLNLVNADFASDERVDAMINGWQKSAPPLPPVPAAHGLPAKPAPATLTTQAQLLLKRHGLKLLPRDPKLVIIIVCLAAVEISFTGLYFWHSNRSNDQNVPVNRFQYFLNVTAIPLLFNILHAVGAATERTRVERELISGMYSPTLYVSIISILTSLVTTLTSVFIVVYAYIWGDFHSWNSLLPSMALASAAQYYFAAMAQASGWIFALATGPTVFIGAFSIAFIASGYYLDLDQIVWPLRTVSYTNPLLFMLSGVPYHLIGDADDIPGATPCNAGSPDCFNGYTCLNMSTDTNCVGITGEQVLHSLHARLGAIVDVNDVVLKHFGIILAQSVVIRLIFLAVLTIQLRLRVEPSLPTGAESAPLQLRESAEMMLKDEVEGDSVQARTEDILALAASNPNHDVELAIEDVSLQLDAVGDEMEGKFLLQNVSMQCKAREILSIMGPSGAGKTTLLKVLSCESSPGRSDHITGRVTLNRQLMTPEIFRNHCAYMPQNDAGLFVFLSAEAHIYYAISLYRGRLLPNQCAELTDAILEKTGLQSCKKTRAGSPEYPGLSGGQRRRLSLALSLANTPALLIADEPTTGLDDAAAGAVMTLLRAVAVSSKMAIVATIHQPGASIYSHMGSLLILSRARTAYYGQASQLMEYVSSLGKPVPLGVSIAEHVLDLINADFASEEEVDAVLNAWQKKAPRPPLLASSSAPLPPASERPPTLRVLMVLIQKMGAILSRSNNFTRDKILLQFATCTVYGAFTVSIHDREQDDVNQCYWGIYILFTNAAFPNAAGALGYSQRFPAFKRELQAGMFSPEMYWLVSSVLDSIVNVFAAIAGVVPLCLFMGTPANSFFGLICLQAALISFFSAVLEMAAIYGFDAAVMASAQVTLHLTMTSNAFMNADEIIWPLRVFYYILPGRYIFNSMIQLGFGDEHDEWNGAYRLSSAPPDIRGSQAGLDAQRSGATFVCPDSDICYGDNGQEVKISFGAIHSAATAYDAWGVNFAIVMAQTLAVRLMGAAALKLYLKSCDQYSVGTEYAASSATERSKLLA